MKQQSINSASNSVEIEIENLSISAEVLSENHSMIEKIELSEKPGNKLEYADYHMKTEEHKGEDAPAHPVVEFSKDSKKTKPKSSNECGVGFGACLVSSTLEFGRALTLPLAGCVGAFDCGLAFGNKNANMNGIVSKCAFPCIMGCCGVGMGAGQLVGSLTCMPCVVSEHVKEAVKVGECFPERNRDYFKAGWATSCGGVGCPAGYKKDESGDAVPRFCQTPCFIYEKGITTMEAKHLDNPNAELGMSKFNIARNQEWTKYFSNPYATALPSIFRKSNKNRELNKDDIDQAMEVGGMIAKNVIKTQFGGLAV